MTTPRTILKRAYSKIGVRAAESPLTAAEVDDGLDVLNDLLKMWNSTGILKGVDPVDDADTDLGEPAFSSAALKAECAVRLACEYGVEVSKSLAVDASTSVTNMIVSSVNLQDIDYPSTLPKGSGNQCGGDYYNQEFFAENQARNF